MSKEKKGLTEHESSPASTIVDFASFKKAEKKELEPGDKFTIPDLGGSANFGFETKLPWVKIVRGENGHGTSDEGIIKEGATVTVMGASNEFGILCKYNGSSKRGGTTLNDGAMFFIDKDDLLFWPQLIKLQEQKRARQEDEITKILEGAPRN